MSRSAFDRVARDYEEIHNRSLPPGVHSDEFVAQKAERVIQWIGNQYRNREFCYLDFGCGNGRLFRFLVEAEALRPLFAEGRLRLFGFDTSMESLAEARRITNDDSVLLAGDLNHFPMSIRFDLVISCNVFHHIAPADRGAAAQTLQRRMKRGARLVIWEHNPFNPFTRLLVRMCPFDGDARLLKLRAAVELFSRNSFRYLQHAYVHVVPPNWQRLKPVSRLEAKLARLPLGAQYWVMFEKDE